AHGVMEPMSMKWCYRHAHHSGRSGGARALPVEPALFNQDHLSVPTHGVRTFVAYVAFGAAPKAASNASSFRRTHVRLFARTRPRSDRICALRDGRGGVRRGPSSAERRAANPAKLTAKA